MLELLAAFGYEIDPEEDDVLNAQQTTRLLN